MRLTQAERRQQTLQKLHEATVECIVNKGFSRLTTADIAEAADLSQGALFRYYPSKTAAVAGATRYLFDKVIRDFNCLLGEPCEPNLMKIVDDLEAWFHSADFIAVSRLFAESSADAELKEAIQPIIEQHRLNTHALIEQAFPAESQAMLRSAAHAVIYLMQGIATEKHLIADDFIERDIMQLVRNAATLLSLQSNSILPDSINGRK
jgi:AcrR family transcriptional regulator